MLLSLPWPKVFAGASGWFSSYTIRPQLIKQEVSAFNFLSGARANFTLTVYHYCTTSCGDSGDGVGGKACSSLQKKNLQAGFKPLTPCWMKCASFHSVSAETSVAIDCLMPMFLGGTEIRLSLMWTWGTDSDGAFFLFCCCCCCWYYFNKRRRCMRLVVHSCVDAPIKSAV